MGMNFNNYFVDVAMKICLILDGTHAKIGILFIPVFVDNLYQEFTDIYPRSLNTLNSKQPLQHIL